MVIYMRYLYLFFIFFLSPFSYAQEPPNPTCGSRSVQSGCTDMSKISGATLTYFSNACYTRPGKHQAFESGTNCTGSGTTAVVCYSECTCPDGYYLNTIESGGVKSSSCVPDVPSENPDECEFGDVYDPETGTVTCNEGSGNESSPPTSSAASSPQCVVPGDYNGDCIPDSEQGSSTAASTPTSTPDSPPSSSPSSGDDEGNDGGGGGGGGEGSGNNTGGGSGSAVASSAPSGSNSSWTPHSGYGGWLPVSENSPCPNKYQDNTGQWWCAAAGSGSGQNTSQGAGQCDPTSKDYLACISLNQPSNSGSSVCSPSSPDYLDCSGKLANAESTITGLSQSFTETIDEKTEQYKTALTEDLDGFSRDGVPFKEDPGILKSALLSLLPVSTSCNPPDLKIMGRNYSLDCKYFNLFKQAFGWFLAVMTAWQIWHMAIRPVER